MNILDKQYRHLLKVHEDLLSVHEVINDMYNEYKELGYKMHLKLPSSFSYYLEDKTLIMVFWEKGRVYENPVKFKFF